MTGHLKGPWVFLACALIFLLVFSPYSVCLIHKPANTFRTASISSQRSLEDVPLCADGFFTGTYNYTNQFAGFIKGYIKLGRQPTTGSFQGQWSTATANKSGHLKGIFYQEKLYGFLSMFGHKINIPLLGTLTGNKTHFKVHIPSEKKSLISATGLHQASFLPTPTGPYLLGTETFHLIDHFRDEEFTEKRDNREIMMQLWYPRQNTSYGNLSPYMDSPTFQWLKQQSPIPLFMIPDQAYTFIHTHALTGTAPASKNSPFPIIIFSHGYDGVQAIYTSLIENLASHGFIVAAINHPYIAGITVFPDGRTIDLAPMPNSPTEAQDYLDKALRAVVGDIGFALDFLTALSATNATWKNALDLSHIGIYGHSFGGGAAAMICYLDDRVTAGLALDGYFQGDVVTQGFEKPFLMMLAEDHFNLDTITQALWERITGGAYRVEVRGSAHYDYTDVGILLSHLTPLLPRKIVGFGTIEPKRLIKITNDYEQAFFGVYLQGINLNSILRLSDIYGEVNFEYKP